MPISGHSVATNVQGIRSRIRGLYAVTPDWPDPERLSAAVSAAVRGGAGIVQIRSKQVDRHLQRAIAQAVFEACRRHGAICLVNDDVELAVELGADGVHLGADDTAPGTARARLGPAAIIGVSCYDDFSRAQRWPEADYVAFGSVFVSRVKPTAVRAPLDLFGRARAAGLCSVAIGGIDRGNAARVFAAGADAVAVISDLFEAPLEQIEQRAAEFTTLAAAAR
ncbi:MAG: thiamine phosphate synthase [Burkholderiaceae bacterium]